MIRTGVLNGGVNLNHDYMFNKALSHILSEGVLLSSGGELEVTTNQVASGAAFVEVTRTTVTPNETFLVPVEVTTDTVVDTSGDGYIIIRMDDDMINDGTIITEQDGSGIATLEKVASLPSSNYLLLATLSSGVITDARTYTRSSNRVTEKTRFYAVDTGSANSIVATIPNLEALTAGLEIMVKIAANNTTSVVANINGFGAIAVKKRYSSDMVSGDLLAEQFATLVYDAVNNTWQCLSVTSTVGAGLSKATQGQSETGSDDSAYMTPLQTAYSVDYRNRVSSRVAGESFTSGTYLVYVHTDGKVYKSSNATEASCKIEGWITVTSTININDAISYYSIGKLSEVTMSGMTAGPQYLSTGGQVTATKPSLSGSAPILKVGSAKNSTLLIIEPQRIARRMSGTYSTTGTTTTSDVITTNFPIGRISFNKRVDLEQFNASTDYRSIHSRYTIDTEISQMVLRSEYYRPGTSGIGSFHNGSVSVSGSYTNSYYGYSESNNQGIMTETITFNGTYTTATIAYAVTGAGAGTVNFDRYVVWEAEERLFS